MIRTQKERREENLEFKGQIGLILGRTGWEKERRREEEEEEEKRKKESQAKGMETELKYGFMEF